MHFRKALSNLTVPPCHLLRGKPNRAARLPPEPPGQGQVGARRLRAHHDTGRRAAGAPPDASREDGCRLDHDQARRPCPGS